MALRRILDASKTDLLRKRSRPITEINRRVLQLLDDMADTMHSVDGCGLAAPQVGALRRAVVVDVGEGLIELINPELIEASDEREDSEGCLSIPGMRGFVVRPHKVTVRGLNRKGEPVEIKAEELAAVALCHEIDHLDGILFLDKLTRIEDAMVYEYVEDEDGAESERA
ncbi:MAG: peptide deformylase [Oscillospiraceae bacterium]|jgi:peptide deformylase|nr:peptide deformylase [Oscillospiraceae bacterium]